MRKMDGVDSGLKEVLWSILDEVERNREESVTRREFHALTDIVVQLGQTTKELAEAQKRTEGKLEQLTERVDQLAEAQKKTEVRLEQLTERVDQLTERVGQLAEAQKKTEIRLAQLTERVDQLADAIYKLSLEVTELTKSHKDLQKQVGGLTTTIGYTLENEAYKSLPDLLLRDFGFTVQGRLKRDYVKDKAGDDIEVNILGKAKNRDNKEIMIIGESKSQLSKNQTDEFIRKKLSRMQGVFEDVFPVLVTHMISSPDVKTYLEEKGIALYYSYDF
jgi:uncharacterized phage infection (PIP) family protein YhgE